MRAGSVPLRTRRTFAKFPSRVENVMQSAGCVSVSGNSVSPIVSLFTGAGWVAKTASSLQPVWESVANELPLSTQAVTTHPVSLFDLSSTAIARYLSTMDLEAFRRISLSELVVWPRRQRIELSPNICAMIKQFNRISLWTATTILGQHTLKDRAKMLHKFIDIGKKLKQQHNFNGLMAILSALNSAAVYRLRHTRTALSARTRTSLAKLNTLMMHDKSFAVYRAALSRCSMPAVPYLGLCLTDATFVDQGN